MLKRSLAAVFALLFTFSFGSMAFASEDTQTDSTKGLEIIEKANQEIDNLINQAVEVGAELQTEHLEKITHLQNDAGLTDIEKKEKITEEIQKYNAALDKLIVELQDKAVELTNKGIEDAAQYGVYGVCEWKLVQIADRTVWVDPIKVFGF
ncbi:hypothetical protein JOC77_000569 [Peribacillus deserti]|uniref:DUF3347 domain-containing protein n=1 Tax=Peribacillus deserti TaxID=673318 RepID=A0ABS2QDE5_9BACI|nr:hypothetical protein [Peribacillus deserti]MBM7691164.1 hypothetical protein [Peribacillus deserti]